MREYRPGAPRNNAMNNSTTFVNSNKSHYQGSNGPSTGPRYNNYASKYEAVSLVSIIEILFYLEKKDKHLISYSLEKEKKI